MLARCLLILTPIVIVLAMLQSAFWIPRYTTLASQGALVDDPGQATTQGEAGAVSATSGSLNAQAALTRSQSFVEASIADAKILNPILHSDSASFRIVGLVFDGLLALDENGDVTPALATDYTINEWVYVAAEDSDADALAETLSDRLAADPALASSVLEIGVTPASQQAVEIPLPVSESESEADAGAVTPRVDVTVAPRVKIVFDQVHADLEEQLARLGVDTNVPADAYLTWSATADVTDDAVNTVASNQIPSIERNPVVEFNLRQDVRFHDGHGFDADDVIFTYDAIMDPKNLSPRTSSFEPIKSIEALDDYSVRAVYKRLFAPAVRAWTMPILPSHLLEDVDQDDEPEEDKDAVGMRDSPFNRSPVGTGAYRFGAWSGDEVIRLTANDDYFAGAVDFSDYAYRVLPDTLVQELEFNAGATDIYSPQPYQVDRFRSDGRYRAVSLPGNGYSYIAYNLRRPLFSDPRVRRALSMAINVDDIVRYVMFGEADRSTGIYALNTPWYNHDVEAIPYDPDGAIRLLEDAGWSRNSDGVMEKDGKEFAFSLITNQGNATRKAILSIAQDAWRRIGVRADTQVFEWAVFLEDFVNPGEYDALVLGWRLDADPDLYQLWHSSQTDFGELNFTGYKNPEVDELIEKIRIEYDHDKQKALAHELHAMVAADQPYTFLFSARGTRVLNPSLKLKSEDGGIEDIDSVPSGNIYQHFERWTRPSLSPVD